MVDDLILAIETSTRRGSVALGGGAAGLGWRALSVEQAHATELLPAIRELLAEAGSAPRNIGIVAFSQGPGSFTGLRVAATVARTWQAATGCRVVAVPTAAVIARNTLTHPDRPHRVAVMHDIKRGQLLAALFERDATGEYHAVRDAARVDATAWLAGLPRPCWVTGDGAAAWATTLHEAGLSVLEEEYARPDARQVLLLGRQQAAAGRFCSPAEIVPLYLRPPECEEVYERRRAAAQQRRTGQTGSARAIQPPPRTMPPPA